MASESRHFGWTCKLCCAPVINIDRYVLPSCCKKEYLHWNCTQELVDKGEASSCYCPLCASEDEFIQSMKSVGISFPLNMKTASSPERTENGQDANHDWKWTPRNKKQEGLFNKAKDELHTFLAMNKEGIRLKEAFNMMFSQAAITIPLREMGFDNFYHFIYNCPDVCSLKQLPDKEDLYLFVKGNVDEHITHIRALVQKQKWRERIPSCGVRVTPGNTYESDPVILLRYRSRPREKLPITPKSDRDVEDEREETGNVSAEVVHVIPLNKAAAADPRNLVVLPSKSTRKANNNNSKLSARNNEHVKKAGSTEFCEKEPQEFKARLLGVDQHGWFYVRRVTEQVAHWDKFMREFKHFYESDEVQKTKKLAAKDVCLGATLVACYTPQSSGDLQKKRLGRVTILRIDDKAGHCTVQDIDNSDIGDATISDLYMMEERFTEEDRPRGAIRVALAGTEMFILSGRLRRKFSELKLSEIATVTVIQKCHPTFECPVVSIQVWNEKSLRLEDLKYLLNL